VAALLHTADPALLCAGATEGLLRALTRQTARLAAVTARTVVALAEQAAAPLLARPGITLDPVAVLPEPGEEHVALAGRVSPRPENYQAVTPLPISQRDGNPPHPLDPTAPRRRARRPQAR